MGCGHSQADALKRIARWTASPLLALLGCGGPPSHKGAFPIAGVTNAERPSATETTPAVRTAPAASVGTSNSIQTTETNCTVPDATTGSSEPSIEPDESPAAVAQGAAPVDVELEPVASRYAPVLMRKGASCWIHDDPRPGPPVVVVLYVNGATVYHVTCWAGYFDTALHRG